MILSTVAIQIANTVFVGMFIILLHWTTALKFYMFQIDGDVTPSRQKSNNYNMRPNLSANQKSCEK